MDLGADVVTRARIVGFLTITVVLIGASGYFLTRNTRQEVRANLDETPGLRRVDRHLDSSPFELAAPTTTEGPTTIPGGPGSPAISTTAAPTTTTLPVATTTTLPSTPFLPKTIDSLCGMTLSTNSLAVLLTDPSLNVELVITQYLTNLDRYVRASPPSIRGSVEAVRVSLRSLVPTLKSAHWDLHSPQMETVIVQLQSGSGSFAGLALHRTAIANFENTSCPS